MDSWASPHAHAQFMSYWGSQGNLTLIFWTPLSSSCVLGCFSSISGFFFFCSHFLQDHPFCFVFVFRQLENLLKRQAGQMWSSLVSISFLGRGFCLLWWALGAFILLVFMFWPEFILVISRMINPIWTIFLRLESEPTWALKHLDIESTSQTNHIRTSGCGIQASLLSKSP